MMVSTNVRKHGISVTKYYFLHNTKVTSSHMREDMDRQYIRDVKHTPSCCIYLSTVIRVMLCYPGLYTDIIF